MKFIYNNSRVKNLHYLCDFLRFLLGQLLTQLHQGFAVNITFEIHDLTEWVPVTDPLPLIKFGRIRQIQLNMLNGGREFE